MKMMVGLDNYQLLDINYTCTFLKLLPISNPPAEPRNTTTNVSHQLTAHDHKNELITAS